MERAIEVSGLSKSFGAVKAVRDVSFAVSPGEMFSLVGPDGAGKTTTIRMMCGILRPDAGSVRICGKDIRTEPDEARAHLGYLSQRFSLYGDLSVDENIEYFAEIHGVRDFRTRRDELLEFTRLTPFRRRLAEHLSGGMKQKLALACILVYRPEVILLDEPTTGVDPVSRRDFWLILSELLRQGLAIVMTTPYLDEAERSDRVGFLSEGKILLSDEPSAIRRRAPEEILEIVCRDARAAWLALRNAGIEDVQLFGDRLHLPAGRKSAATAAMEEAGIRPIAVRTVRPSLEDVFISMMRRQEANG